MIKMEFYVVNGYNLTHLMFRNFWQIEVQW